MKYIISILAISFLANLTFGQDFKTKFDQYCQENDTTQQLNTLKEWEKADPKNAELFTSYFNYYFLKSRQEVLSLSTEQPTGESLSLEDSTGKTAGFLGSQIMYINEPLEKCFEKIDEGLLLYPNRLDMRFGKIYVLGQTGNWDRFTEEVLKAIRYSSKNNNNWTWTFNEPREGGKDFFLSSMQDYQLTLYNTGDDNLLVNMRTIAEEILKYYPTHIESLSNLSITYLLTGEYDKGIEPLLRAEELDPTDAIVLSNIAQGYKLKEDKAMAIKYYEKAAKHGDERTAQYAREQIEELKK
ncbi:MAG: tetratricopeptide repeat protein [Lewinellaceae bacterium]|nr:tetratricopeptide repeat protein [Lewinellaceae bacterium]